MENLNFLAGKDKDWIERNFKVMYNPKYDSKQKRYLHYQSPYEVNKLQTNDVIYKRKSMREHLKTKKGSFTFFTNFQFDQLQSEMKKKNIYYYDIYDVMFDDYGKIVGAIRHPVNYNIVVGQTRYPVKNCRYQFSLNFMDFSIFIGDESKLFMNWKENPFEVK